MKLHPSYGPSLKNKLCLGYLPHKVENYLLEKTNKTSQCMCRQVMRSIALTHLQIQGEWHKSLFHFRSQRQACHCQELSHPSSVFLPWFGIGSSSHQHNAIWVGLFPVTLKLQDLQETHTWRGIYRGSSQTKLQSTVRNCNAQWPIQQKRCGFSELWCWFMLEEIPMNINQVKNHDEL